MLTWWHIGDVRYYGFSTPLKRESELLEKNAQVDPKENGQELLRLSKEWENKL